MYSRVLLETLSRECQDCQDCQDCQARQSRSRHCQKQEPRPYVEPEEHPPNVLTHVLGAMLGEVGDLVSGVVLQAVQDPRELELATFSSISFVSTTLN